MSLELASCLLTLFFLAGIAAALVLMIASPGLVLWLPRLLGYGN
ncbi:MAG: hypothetical protein AAF414_03210 [Pseudomonadota bacterium]